MSEHSKGPWRYDARPLHESVRGADGVVLAVVQHRNSDATREANGLMMAASPELVEALRACQLALRATSKAAKDYSHELGLARDALKKAGVKP